MTPEELKEIVRLHGLWLVGDPAGKRANLSRANLTGANLSWADLTRANLTGANLSWADLTRADLTGAYLTEANLTGANLTGANLSWANLSWANLSRANLTGANLSWANLTWTNLAGADLTGTKAMAFQSSHYQGHSVPGPHGRILQFGCVQLTLDEWDAQAADLAKQHEPDNSAKFEALTRAWVAVCRAMDL